MIDGITDLINGEKYEHKTIGFLMLELLIPEIMREQQAKTLALPLLNIPKEGSIDIELLVLKHLCTINTEVIDTILEQLFESIDSDISEIRYGYICEILAIKWQYDLNQIHLLLSKISRHNFSVPYTFCNKIGKITHLNQISESTAPITNLYSYFQNWLLSRTNLSSNQLFLIWLIVCKN
ncbi:MAG: hypothetical protein HWD59_09875 [Coxiellaceae bacterium]|nr:MAG: hypothetical protein HWD59_09875 [Coxiellaceae bacterium]